MNKGQLKEIECLKKSLVEKKSVVYRLECDLRKYKNAVIQLEKELEWCEKNYQ